MIDRRGSREKFSETDTRIDELVGHHHLGLEVGWDIGNVAGRYHLVVEGLNTLVVNVSIGRIGTPGSSSPTQRL